jgi:hypothetical protein
MVARPQHETYGSPLPSKLGIRQDHDVAFVRAPDGFRETLGELPDGVRVRSRATGPLDAIVGAPQGPREQLRATRRGADPAAGLWVAWPKRGSGVETDMTEDVAREVALANGIVDTKVCAIDETWSGLRLVKRLEDR